MRLWQALWPEKAEMSWLAGLAVSFTWPLVWAAVSGMETLLYAAIGLWVVVLFVEHQLDMSGQGSGRQPAQWRSETKPLRFLAAMGVLSGLLILARPDGVVLAFLIVIALGLERRSKGGRLKPVLAYVIATAVPLVPYMAFNLWASGNIWPNTFYAKQAEYAVLLAQPLPSRIARLLLHSLGGPETGWLGSSSAHLFLLPGLSVSTWKALRADRARGSLRHLLPLIWAGGHVFLYAWRLPVTYQHGRYLFAAIPIWVVYGLAGWHWLLSRAGYGRIALIGKRVVLLSFIALMLVFMLLGAQAYATDVAFIEGEMVNVALWLSQNTPPDTLIASHDIGAIGYFAERPLLDLAGLITPEIIPWLGDEMALSRYIVSSEASYLVTAPGWPYDAVVTGESAALVYTTNFKWTQLQGINNMSVYQLLVQ
jgi:hypothetical protein